MMLEVDQLVTGKTSFLAGISALISEAKSPHKEFLKDMGY
jgi:hypothetical protein